VPVIQRSRHWLLLIAFLAYDFSAFALHAQHTGGGIESTLAHWDSNWFVDILGSGRDSEPTQEARARWAFLPLVIEVVGLLSRLFHVSPYAMGSAFSLLCLVASVRLIARRKMGSEFGAPVSVWGWYFFFLSPASYALHTFHTEAPFLLLSLVAFHSVVDGKFWWCAMAMALALWTRNQGVVLAATLVFVWWKNHGRHGAVALALLAALSYSLLLGYAAFKAGTPWAFHRAQANWEHAHSLKEVMLTLIMGNEESPLEPTWILRQLFAWGWLALTILVWKRLFESAYAAGSFAPMLLQGTFHNVFRFGSVMFSLLFFFGDAVARMSKPVRWGTAALWLALHHFVLLSWLKDRWAY
jgi:Gpi18-like mannosyltransferase